MQAESTCIYCKHLSDKFKCLAFPDGIPEEILTGDHDHKKPFEGDNGIQFEPKKEGEDEHGKNRI